MTENAEPQGDMAANEDQRLVGGLLVAPPQVAVDGGLDLRASLHQS